MIENVRTKCIIFGEVLKIRVIKFEQNLPKIHSRSTKIAITACKFLKNFGGISCFSISFKLISSAEKKNTLEKMWRLCPSPLLLNLLATPLYGRDDCFYFVLHLNLSGKLQICRRVALSFKIFSNASLHVNIIVHRNLR